MTPSQGDAPLDRPHAAAPAAPATDGTWQAPTVTTATATARPSALRRALARVGVRWRWWWSR
jgi:hypothetical protein